MLQRMLSLLYLGASFALGLFILVHIAQKDDVGAVLGTIALVAYVATLYATQRAGKKRKSLRAAPPLLAGPKAP